MWKAFENTKEEMQMVIRKMSKGEGNNKDRQDVT